MMLMPGKTLMIAGGLALSGLIAGAVAGSREPAPVVTKATAAAAQFDQRWNDTPVDQPLLRKSDRLAFAVPGPKAVPVERVLPEPVLPPPVEKPSPRPVERERHASVERHARTEHNVCTRHHMRKVEIRGGRSWRCRK